jgi:hypothetical protein
VNILSFNQATVRTTTNIFECPVRGTGIRYQNLIRDADHRLDAVVNVRHLVFAGNDHRDAIGHDTSMRSVSEKQLGEYPGVPIGAIEMGRLLVI